MHKYCLYLALIGGILFASCGTDQNDEFHFKEQGNDVPQFNADSAYHFVEQQLSYGPRNPNTEGHRQTKEYLVQKLRSYAGQANVFSQEFTTTGYDGDTLALANVIAAFNPQSSDRIMLSAHWDTRPKADEDSKNEDQPILGADDGASGVAVLLELARQFEKQPPPIGVDIVLFDGEDYGEEGDLDHYFLGSRHWAENPPVKGYSPRFGILLDMVGGEGARFPKEGYSMQFASELVNEVWAIADDKGYDSFFIPQEGNSISDDHLIVNKMAGIPMINIIRHEVGDNGAKFAPYWHTHEDDIDVISKSTMQAVGQVVAELTYNRINTSDTESN
ncbi:MAG: M28 family peptidase [Bacteroidota bacterium]